MLGDPTWVPLNPKPWFSRLDIHVHCLSVHNCVSQEDIYPGEGERLFRSPTNGKRFGGDVTPCDVCSQSSGRRDSHLALLFRLQVSKESGGRQAQVFCALATFCTLVLAVTAECQGSALRLPRLVWFSTSLWLHMVEQSRALQCWVHFCKLSHAQSQPPCSFIACLLLSAKVDPATPGALPGRSN